VFLVLIAAVDAQSGGPTQEEKNDKDDKDDEVNPNDQLDSIPSDFEDIDLSDDALDFNSTEPSESPSAMRINSESSSPSMLPSSSPSRGESPQLPTTPFGECAGKPCDKDDSTSCSCRSGLECRQRSFGQYICSQVSRTERTRLSAAAGIGGAAGRDRRGRNVDRVRG